MESPLVVGRPDDAASPACADVVAAAADVGAPTASGRAGADGARLTARCHKAAPHWPAALGARVHVDGHGAGTYVRFDPNFLVSGHAHTIDFDEGGEQTLTSDRWCLRRLCCCSAVRPVADGWRVIDTLGSVEVSTLMAPELQTIALTKAMSVCELRSEIAQRFGVPPEQQRLVLQREGDDAGAEGRAGGHGAWLAEGADPSDTVWRAGARASMRLLLVATDAPVRGAHVSPDDGAWSMKRVLGLRRAAVRLEVARVKPAWTVTSIGAVVCVIGGAVGGAQFVFYRFITTSALSIWGIVFGIKLFVFLCFVLLGLVGSEGGASPGR
jgi:hypothetical protein